MLPPVFYPVAVLPDFLRFPALLIPAAAAELARTLAGLSRSFDPIIFAWTLLAVLFANRAVKWSLD